MAKARVGAPAARRLPAVGKLLQHPLGRELEAAYGIPRVTEALRAELAALRARLLAGEEVAALEAGPDALLAAAGRRLAAARPAGLVRVINATGVVLHTNLGRAPLAPRALAAAAEVCAGYCDLELDLETGQRGRRGAQLEALLQTRLGAEAALVVNNNAAAVLLVLDTLAKGRDVLIARSQMVEIGGGFRIPSVLERSGCRLREIGCTNKVHLEDYRGPLVERPALVLVVHRSNFALQGFVGEPGLAEIVAAAHEHAVPVLYDMGSGLLEEPGVPWLAGGEELTIRQALAGGADVVTFSGDKLLGGPQAGLILARRSLRDLLQRNPLYRALRVGKVTMVLLEATLRAHRDDVGEGGRGAEPSEPPTLRMLTEPPEVVRARAEDLLAALPAGAAAALGANLVPSTGRSGGGAYPVQAIPSWAVAVGGPGASPPQELAARLRRGSPPVIGRLDHDRLLLDLRTVLPEEIPALARGLEAARG